MSIRGFIRALFRGQGGGQDGPKHAGHDLADEVRDALGAQGGGARGGGRMTGSAVYRYLEGRKRP